MPSRGTRQLDESGSLFLAEISMERLDEWSHAYQGARQSEGVIGDTLSLFSWGGGTGGGVSLTLSGSTGENGSGSARIIENSTSLHGFYDLSY